MTASKDAFDRARVVHQHVQRLRNFILAAQSGMDPWEGMARVPTHPQVKALLAVGMFGSCTLKDLARSLTTSPAAASEMIERLVEMGLVSRTQDPDDRRRVLITLTEDARTRVRNHEEGILAQLAILMDRLGPQWSIRWVELAERISVALDDEGFPSSRPSTSDES